MATFGLPLIFCEIESGGGKLQQCRSCVVDLRLLRKWAETAADEQLFSTTNAASNGPWWNELLVPDANVAKFLVFYLN